MHVGNRANRAMFIRGLHLAPVLKYSGTQLGELITTASWTSSFSCHLRLQAGHAVEKMKTFDALLY